jgi:hypothetical protein
VASLGRDNIGSFGRRQQPAELDEAGSAPVQVGSLSLDLVVHPVVSKESLQQMTEDVAAAVRRGVELGFATAGTPQIGPEAETEISPE